MIVSWFVLDGDNVLLINQTDPKENDIWTVNFSGTWSRLGIIFPAQLVRNSEGTIYHDTEWICTSDSVVRETDDLTWEIYPTDKYVRITSSDATSGYLDHKITLPANSGLTKTVIGSADEQLQLYSTGTVFVDGSDATRDYISNKLVDSIDIDVNILTDVGTGAKTIEFLHNTNGLNWERYDYNCTNHYFNPFSATFIALNLPSGTGKKENIYCELTGGEASIGNYGYYGDLKGIGSTIDTMLLRTDLINRMITIGVDNPSKCFNILNDVASGDIKIVPILTGIEEDICNVQKATFVYHKDVDSGMEKWYLISYEKFNSNWEHISDVYSPTGLTEPLSSTYSTPFLNYNVSPANFFVDVSFTDFNPRYLGLLYYLLYTLHAVGQSFLPLNGKFLTISAKDNSWFHINTTSFNGGIYTNLDISQLKFLTKATFQCHSTTTTIEWELISFERMKTWFQSNLVGTHDKKNSPLIHTYTGIFPFVGISISISTNISLPNPVGVCSITSRADRIRTCTVIECVSDHSVKNEPYDFHIPSSDDLRVSSFLRRLYSISACCAIPQTGLAQRLPIPPPPD